MSNVTLWSITIRPLVQGWWAVGIPGGGRRVWQESLTPYFSRLHHRWITLDDYVVLTFIGGSKDAHPLWVQFLSFLCSFWENFGQIIGRCPHLIGWLGNPGSATDLHHGYLSDLFLSTCVCNPRR